MSWTLQTGLKRSVGIDPPNAVPAPPTMSMAACMLAALMPPADETR